MRLGALVDRPARTFAGVSTTFTPVCALAVWKRPRVRQVWMMFPGDNTFGRDARVLFVLVVISCPSSSAPQPIRSSKRPPPPPVVGQPSYPEGTYQQCRSHQQVPPPDPYSALQVSELYQSIGTQTRAPVGPKAKPKKKSVLGKYFSRISGGGGEFSRCPRSLSAGL